MLFRLCSIILKRNAEQLEQLVRVLKTAVGDHEIDIHTEEVLDVLNVDFREDHVLLQAYGKVAGLVKGVR